VRHERIFRIHEGDPEPINCQYFNAKHVAVHNAKRRADLKQKTVFVDRRDVFGETVHWTLVHTEKVDN
jgi:hypothetical protein